MKFIVAHDLNNVIGIDGKIAWHFKEDFKFFKRMTTGHACIMGLRTYEEIMKLNPNGLSNRTMIVLSRRDVPNVYTMKDSSPEELERLRVHLNLENLDEVFVIGGSQTYQAFLPYCKVLYATLINKEYTTDDSMNVAKFPYNLKFLKSIDSTIVLNKITENGVELTFNRYDIKQR